MAFDIVAVVGRPTAAASVELRPTCGVELGTTGGRAGLHGVAFSVVVTAACAGNAGNPLTAGTGTGAFDVPLTALTFGTQYYFYITGNPSDNSGPSGAFSFLVPTPVALQSFSVD